MEAFIQKYQKDVTGVLRGWDRVRLRGMQRILANVGGRMSFLSHVGVLMKDFGAFVERTCLRVREASEQAARRLDRPVQYLFSSAQALARVYPTLGAGALTTFSSRDVMRYWGKKPSGPFKGEVVSSYLHRPEGVRVKHSVQSNSVKMYDKQGNVRRIETTMNDPYRFKAYRPKESDQKGARQLRKGVADAQRRAEICQGVNDRYLEALASLDSNIPVKQLVASACQPARWKGRNVRRLHPRSAADRELLAVISRGEYVLQGFRNRDLVPLLYPKAGGTPEEQHRTSARVTRLLRLLRAHGFVRKITGTHRYRLTPKGRRIATAVLRYQSATLPRPWPPPRAGPSCPWRATTTRNNSCRRSSNASRSRKACSPSYRLSNPAAVSRSSPRRDGPDSKPPVASAGSSPSISSIASSA